MPTSLRDRVRLLGPGLVLAAAGIGAADVVVASVSGIRFGTTLLWVVVFTVTLKFALTEALARYQLATGETVVHAWATRLPRAIGIGFGIYLLFWTFMVGAALSGACGLAVTSFFPGVPLQVGAALHAVAAAALVGFNRYARFQRVMKALIGTMAICVLVCAVLVAPSLGEILRGFFVPTIPPAGGGAQVLSLLGGIGGSVTMLCYGYWMRLEGWRGGEKLPTVRGDVGFAYLFTGLFGAALIVIAAGVHAQGAAGSRIALEVAAQLGRVAGPAAHWIFLVGFWCTVFTAMLGVWQGVPQVYVDLVGAWRESERAATDPAAPTGQDRRIYLAALAYITLPPLALIWFKQPVAVVVAFAITGAFFVPFLSATLLYLNNRREWMGALANRWLGNLTLVVCLLVFGAVCVREIVTVLNR